MLSSTEKRDEDQVVSRWVNPEKQDQTPPHNILMVDQLWIWRFTDTRGDKPVEYVISSFPDRAGVDIDPTAYDDNLRRTVLEPRDGRRPISGPNDLVFRILGACANVFDRCQDVKLLQFLQIFENSIGKVVSHDLYVWLEHSSDRPIRATRNVSSSNVFRIDPRSYIAYAKGSEGM